jgi:hypothetical protein
MILSFAMVPRASSGFLLWTLGEIPDPQYDLMAIGRVLFTACSDEAGKAEVHGPESEHAVHAEEHGELSESAGVARA